MTGSIFISYRRADSAGWAGRLHEDLEAKFGRERLFFDILTIEPGQDFTEAIRERLQDASVVLAVIGPQWLSVKNEQGQRRLDDKDDHVRAEIATAMQLKLPIIPVLVGGAGVPASKDLPEDLKGLATRHGYELTDRRWDLDVDELATHLKKCVEAQIPAPREPPIAPQPKWPSWKLLVIGLCVVTVFAGVTAAFLIPAYIEVQSESPIVRNDIATPPAVQPADYRVFIQFAGNIPREQIKDLNQKLRTLGWNVQGDTGERLPSASGLSEVRYSNPDNKQAALALANAVQDMKVSSNPVTAKEVPIIASKTLEIWISR